MLRRVTVQCAKKQLYPTIVAQKRFAAKTVLDTIEKQHDLRKKFIAFQGENTHEYMGVELLSYSNNESAAAKAGKKWAKFINSFFLSSNVPANFSDEAADLYGRATDAIDGVINVDWRRINSSYDHDEAANCASQYSAIKDLLLEHEKKTIKPIIDGLTFAWEVALEANYLCSVVGLLREKYRNQFEFPASDLPIVCRVVDEYLALKERAETDTRAQSKEFFTLGQKLEESIKQDLIFLKQKLILSELSIKYPQLFK